MPLQLAEAPAWSRRLNNAVVFPDSAPENNAVAHPYFPIRASRETSSDIL